MAKKQSHTEYLGETRIFSNYEYTDITNLISFLKSHADSGCNYVQISAEAWSDGVESISIQPIKVIEESDEEYNQRLEKERLKRQREIQEENEAMAKREYDLYLFLKQKYETQK